MKPSQFFMDTLAMWQQISVEAEVAGDTKLQRIADWSAPIALMYAAFFKTVGL